MRFKRTSIAVAGLLAALASPMILPSPLERICVNHNEATPASKERQIGVGNLCITQFKYSKEEVIMIFWGDLNSAKGMLFVYDKDHWNHYIAEATKIGNSVYPFYERME